MDVNFINLMTDKYQSVLSLLPPSLALVFNLIVLLLIVFFYCIIIWKFYRFIAKKDIVELNLIEKVDGDDPRFSTRVLYGLLYFLEYLIILPLLILGGFIFFSFFLVLMTEKSIPFGQILLISATIIGVIRLTAYYNEELSKDIAKLLPLTLLAVAITRVDFLNTDRITTSLQSIPSFYSNVLVYFLFIVLLEFLLRIFDLLFVLVGFKKEQN